MGKMSSTTPRMSPRIAARLRATTIARVLLKVTVFKKCMVNIILKTVTRLTHALFCFFNYVCGSCKLLPFIFSLMHS